MTKRTIRRSILGGLVAGIIGMWSGQAIAAAGCYSSGFIGPKMITDVCWNCVLPIRIAGVPMGGDGYYPEDAAKNPLCICKDGAGLPHPGVTTSMWEPARLVEFQRVPGCSSILNGVRFPFNRTFQGSHGNAEHGGGDKTFMHYHYFAFPLLAILNLFVKQSCNPDGYLDMDMMYMSEIDPTWNNDDMAFFANPEAAAVANPIATTACAADAIASTTGRPIKEMFWCAGSWGTLYPLSGNKVGNWSIVNDTSLLTARVLAALHRRGLAWKTSGKKAMCEGKIHPTLPKQQYKFTSVYPRPETKSAHVMGESTMKWGLGRKIPAVGEDLVYMIWRWNDCCNY
ncbi:TraU family protein [Pseudovibrio sp. Ad37]|uniref:TraU family protein n=1 Tax=Pseudovibrio sp. Ad37 TaxID=989422 RepID=UPI0007B1D2E3|nr:TraU family protein [Pseudovibrio sp. Ad37]KZL22681.1 TraU protein [Pseudovibrio sp. Ad37]